MEYDTMRNTTGPSMACTNMLKSFAQKYAIVCLRVSGHSTQMLRYG